MAYSPSPTGLAAAGPSSLYNRYSPSPPNQQPLSKRDKKRQQMADRFAQISAEFDEKRPSYYRKQVQEYQADIHFIQSASLYENKALEEPDYDGVEDTTGSAAASAHGSFRSLQHAHLNGDASSLKTGRHTAIFTKEVNDALEQKDVDLTKVAYSHNWAIDEIQKDHQFMVDVANQEHERLCEDVRRRLIRQVNEKKAMLQKEKDRNDISDSNTHLLHPNQYGLSNGASPGGQQSLRPKTRNTRYGGGDNEDQENGNGNGNGNNKRKRKALADGDSGSPGPAGREIDQTSSKEAIPKQETASSTAPFYTIDRLFSEKELNIHYTAAQMEVLDMYKRRKLNADAQHNSASLVPTNANASDAEDDAAEPTFGTDGQADESLLLAAPEMGRSTTNTSYHATRNSQKAMTLNNAVTEAESLGALRGRYDGIKVVAQIAALPKDHHNKRMADDFLRAPPLTELEIETDRLMIKQAITDEDAGRESSRKLLEEAYQERVDHVGTGSP